MPSTQKAMQALHAAKLILESSTIVDSPAIREALVRISHDMLLDTAELLVKPQKSERPKHVPWATKDFDIFYKRMITFLHHYESHRNSRAHCAEALALWSQYKHLGLEKAFAEAKEAILQGRRIRSLSEESV
jgi:hypothetical protein